MLYLIKRAKTLMQGGIKEITKVAQTFSEIGCSLYKCIGVFIICCIYF